MQWSAVREHRASSSSGPVDRAQRDGHEGPRSPATGRAVVVMTAGVSSGFQWAAASRSLSQSAAPNAPDLLTASMPCQRPAQSVEWGTPGLNSPST